MSERDSEREQETAFEFPCMFPIKAMGKNTPNLRGVVIEIVRFHVETLTEDAVKLRESKGGKFVSVTVHIEAQSKAQLDAIYMDLKACPDILMSL